MTRVAFAINATLALTTLACAPFHAPAYEPIVSKYGIGTVLHPVQDPGIVANDSPETQAAKEHVHIFAVNGVNPLCLGNFNGFCEYLKHQGYAHTYFGQLYTCYNFAERAREVRQSDPQARIVLIGFSLGSNTVRSIANDLAKDGTTVDLLVYLVGDYVQNTPESRPANVRRILNIRAQGIVFTGGDLFFNGADIDGARNRKLNVRHMLVPSRRETLQLVTEELSTMLAESQIPQTPAKETTAVARPVVSPYGGQ